MLLEFSCSNHKSIRGELLFSALAGKDTAHEENIKPFGNQRVLKSAIIYGANGSGKSNFIDSIALAKNLVVNSIHYQPGQGITQMPHKLSGFEDDSTYKFQFVKNGIRYAYGFTLKSLLVSEEYLYHFPNGKPAHGIM